MVTISSLTLLNAIRISNLHLQRGHQVKPDETPNFGTDGPGIVQLHRPAGP